MKLTKLDVLLTVPLLLAANACGSDEPTELGSVHVKSELVAAATGATIEVTAEDEYAPFIGTKIVVPPNALPTDTQITIDVFTESLMDTDADAVGPAVTFGPAGTQFQQPVEVTLPITESVDDMLVRVYVERADGLREVILPSNVTIDAAAGLIRFTVTHFTTFHPGRARGPCRHVVCTSGQCQNGQCVNSACTPQDCGPAPGVPSILCADGTTAGPVCERNGAGTCGWRITTCPGCQADADCPGTQMCNQTVGQCVPAGERCGKNVCGAPDVCCNASCGMCAPPNVGCIALACTECNTNADCGSSICVRGYCNN